MIDVNEIIFFFYMKKFHVSKLICDLKTRYFFPSGNDGGACPIFNLYV